MKPIHALFAYSLLGSVWLASCSSTTKKHVLQPGDDAGEGGEAGASGQATGGTGGKAPLGEAGEAGTAGTVGEPSAAGQGGQSSEAGAGGDMSASAGAGGSPVCFNDLNESAAGAAPTGTALPAGSYNCQALLAALSPSFDPDSGKLTLDVSQLGPVAGGQYTTYDHYLQGGETNTEECTDGSVLVNENQLVLNVSTPQDLQDVELTGLSLQDHCAGNATLSTAGNNGTCFNLTFDRYNSWQAECLEGSCYPVCGFVPPQNP